MKMERNTKNDSFRPTESKKKLSLKEYDELKWSAKKVLFLINLSVFSKAFTKKQL